MTKNQLDYQKNYETRRHNLESEKEQEYANVSGRLNAQAALTSAGAAVSNANTRASELAETQRHNLYSEDVARRTVRATESRVTAQNYADIGKGTGYLFQAVGKIAEVAGTFG